MEKNKALPVRGSGPLRRTHPVSAPVGESRTKQSFAPLCDINKIVEKHRSTGLVTHVSGKQARYGDVSSIPDYQTALNVVNAAAAAFGELPSKVRERFLNDPARMVAFLRDPENRAEAEKLGLMTPKPKDTPQGVDPGASGGGSTEADLEKNPPPPPPVSWPPPRLVMAVKGRRRSEAF